MLGLLVHALQGLGTAGLLRGRTRCRSWLLFLHPTKFPVVCAEAAAHRTDAPQAGADKGKHREVEYLYYFFQGEILFHFSFPLAFPFYICALTLGLILS